MRRLLHRARRIPCASLLLSAAAAVLFVLPSLASHLQYDRGAIAAGELWRLISGHWTHYSVEHLFWDLLAFAGLGIACERDSRSRFFVCVAASVVAISVSVWLWMPELTTYRGLSGVDSALFALLVTDLWTEGARLRRPGQTVTAAACFATFVLKISFELMTGANVFVNSRALDIIGVPIAHIVGASVGVLLGIVLPGRAARLANAGVLLRGSETADKIPAMLSSSGLRAGQR